MWSSSFFVPKLTELTGHFIDWRRVGELLRSGSHRYSLRELTVRSAIVAATIIPGYLATSYADDYEDDSVLSSHILWALLGATLGFTVSHTIAIMPLIHKRYQASNECHVQETKILELLISLNNHYPNVYEQVPIIIREIMKISVTDEQHKSASQVWGKRKRLLTNLRNKLEEDMSDETLSKTDRQSYWQQENIAIIDSLNNTPSSSIKLKR